MVNLWNKLKAHKNQFDLELKDMFAQNPNRFQQFSVQQEDMLFDYSKQRVQEETLQLLCLLAKEAGLPLQIEALFSGEKLNRSEDRPVLHTALRDQTHHALFLDGKNIKQDIQAVLQQMEAFSEKISRQAMVSAAGHPFTDILCLGIGGSELGPSLLDQALSNYRTADITLHFVSNVDGSLFKVLNHLDPKRTLCIISSKTFTTIETQENALAVKAWFQTVFDSTAALRQMVAVTAQRERAEAFGILPEHIFEFWDWVGGRFSIWSAVGLPIVLSLGMEHFREFLQGAFEMDTHFRTAEFRENIPVLMGLLGIWERNFWNSATHAIMPYDQQLGRFPAYLQQLEMESNGKSVSQTGERLSYDTAPVIWGGVGCNGQHAFMQLLHQGSQAIPIDFIVAADSGSSDRGSAKQTDPQHKRFQEKLLFASCLGQAKALMDGVQTSETENNLSSAKACRGNRPSTLIAYPKLTPRVLGKLIAAYEHKVFVQGVIWGINSFDQWGVELGKTLARKIMSDLDDDASKSTQSTQHLDSSTLGLIDYFKNQSRETA